MAIFVALDRPAPQAGPREKLVATPAPGPGDPVRARPAEARAPRRIRTPCAGARLRCRDAVRRLVSGLLVAAALLLPEEAGGQSATALSPFAGVNHVLPDEPGVVGLSVALHAGVLGIRVGGAVGWRDLEDRYGYPPPGSPRPLVDTWSADVDLLVSPTRLPPLRRLFGGIEPYIFAGVGTVRGRDWYGVPGSAAYHSSGFGVALPVASWLSVDGEARRRLLADPVRAPVGFADGWEYRVGVSLRLGGRGGREARLEGRERERGERPRRRRPRDRRDRPGVRPPAGERGGPGESAVPAWRGGREARPEGREPEGDRGDDAPAGPAARAPERRGASARARLVDAILGTGEAFLGTDYRYGGTDPRSGLDCSGFVQLVYARHGIRLPRTSRGQARVGRPVPAHLGALEPGDLLFFTSTTGGRIDHVAIYAGDGRILHATRSGGEVRYDELRGPRGRWFTEHLTAARRVTGSKHGQAPAALIRNPVGDER